MPERFKVMITPRALSDLESILEYISRHSPQNAVRMIERILGSIEALELLPRRYRIVSSRRGEPPGIRSMPVRPYLIRYRVDDARPVVYILTVRHGARG